MKAKTMQERHSMALWEEVSAASETELKEEDGVKGIYCEA